MRIIRFLIVLSLPFIFFCGCGGENSDTTGVLGEDTGNASPVTAVAAPGAPPARETSAASEKLTARSLVLTVNTEPVRWPEFHFWLNYIGKFYKTAHGIEKVADWGAQQNGMPLRDFFLTTAVGYACKDRAIEAKAVELGIGLSEQDLAEIEERRLSNIRIYGSELEYLRIVASMYMSEEVFNYLTKIDYLGNYLFEHLYGKNGENFSDNDVAAYIDGGGYMCAKYIFRSNLDAEGNTLDSEKRTKNERLLKELLGRLDASDAPLALFTSLMNEYGEDKAVSRYPQGLLFASGTRGEAFETACSNLQENEYSRVVSSDEGCYIILRMPVYPAMIADSSGNTLRYHAAYELFKKQVESWATEMKVEYQDAYYRIDVEEIL